LCFTGIIEKSTDLAFKRLANRGNKVKPSENLLELCSGCLLILKVFDLLLESAALFWHNRVEKIDKRILEKQGILQKPFLAAAKRPHEIWSLLD
jgi:hypothetical protein